MQQSKAALEIGGTFIQVGIGTKTDNKWTLNNKKTFDTRDPEDTLLDLVTYLQQFEFDSIQIASFGPLCLNKDDPQFGSITSTPKLKWQNFPIATRLSQALKKPFAIDTDVNACAMAEFMLGNHNVRQSLAYITIGTGVGVGIIVNGQCVHGMLHPEGGHILVAKQQEDKDFKGVCAFHGDCLEGLCTNVAIAKRLNCPITELPNISDDHPIWELVGFYLAEACQNILYLLSIEKIVLGGGVMNRKLLYPIIDKHLRRLVNKYVEIPENYIVEPQVEDVGLIGALLLQ
ncbi:unnamed protein product (macronuclear) [Paramecium tetraurelia]|uniref:fructokinase n=1 Tax=Paramecium tetraurelia TaxID=5888 RepID=A0BMN9_PARTE|nr:uncharacterized protein GSPATT00030442001 [Paramecium tetraurelia]CAK59806.1 unnamed protein product [Paramecium tetraurelia]|eukprot:XP_001427204.1 hypothetical protein (macronuclear) [Paramecium tetraurelia strain d4-2]